MTVPDNGNGLRMAIGVAFEYQQESMLELLSSGDGILYFCDDRNPKPIGRYKPLALDEVAGYEAWTMVKATGQAFTFE